MTKTLQIRRWKTESKSSGNEMGAIHADLSGKKSLLPTVDIGDTISLNDLFINERGNSEKYRLVAEISPVISNSLFNNVTEVVGWSESTQGVKKVTSLNYNPCRIAGALYKSNQAIDGYEAVRDTQFSNNELGFKYYCGRDIFNNHILRNKSFKSICKFSGETSTPHPDFNTIEDKMRLPNGKKTYSDMIAAAYYDVQTVDTGRVESHLYEIKDIYPFAEAIEAKLVEKNGWFGFENKQTINVFDENNECQDIHKVINSESSSSFITMYPGMKEYSVIPQYNDFSGELENNWNYCLTYPSSSTTDGIEFIYDNGLCLREIYTGAKQSDGTYFIEMSSYSKHGLSDGDVVNVYRIDIDVEDDVPVMMIMSESVSVIDEYSFSVTSSNFDDGISVDIDYPLTGDTAYTQDDEEEPDHSYLYYFKRVVNGIECQYYVRIFSRLPNFRFADQAVTPQTLYGEDSGLIEKYQSIEYEFEKHVSSMGFAETIYGDKICQIVFMDDVDVASLKDNLGRPLTDIYLTVVKNNSGYKEWYGIKGTEIPDDLTGVERSHCFGKITCGFELNENTPFSGCNPNLSNALFLNNIDKNSVTGLSTSIINGGDETDEIDYFLDKHFYGDLCSYSPYEQVEDIIDPVMFRFTTAQRELNEGDLAYSVFSSVTYDELIVDDNLCVSQYATEEEIERARAEMRFMVSQRTVTGDTLCRRNEGYIYSPHFRIGLRHPSVEQKTENGFTFRCMSITEVEDGYEVYTEFPNYSHLGEQVIFFDAETYKAVHAKIKSIVDGKKFICDADFGDETVDAKSIILVRRPEDIPMYSEFLTDGSCSFTWRDIVRNGDENNIGDDEYPFANGRHYVTKKFNLFLRRQDPLMETGLQTIPEEKEFADPYGKVGKKYDDEDTYYKEKETEC